MIEDVVVEDPDVLVARVDAWLDAFEGSDGGPSSLHDWVHDDAVFLEHANLVNPSC